MNHLKPSGVRPGAYFDRLQKEKANGSVLWYDGDFVVAVHTPSESWESEEYRQMKEKLIASVTDSPADRLWSLIRRAA